MDRKYGTINETYNTTRRPQRLRLTPQLIPIPLNIIHTVENHEAILSQHAARPRVRHTAGFLLRARMIIDYARAVFVMC